MFNKIRDWFDTQDRQFNILNSKLGILLSKLSEKKITDVALMRELLGSIKLSDLEDKEMTENERKEYCASISAVYPRIEKDIKKFLQSQIEWTVTKAEDWKQTIFGRGTFNGMDLLLNHWSKANEEHLERLKPQVKFDKHSPLGEIEE